MQNEDLFIHFTPKRDTQKMDGQSCDQWSDLTLLLMPGDVRWEEEDSAAVRRAAGVYQYKIDHNDWVARVDLGVAATDPGAYYTFVKRLKESGRFTPVLLNFELALKSQHTHCPDIPTRDPNTLVSLLEEQATVHIKNMHEGKT